MRKRDIFKLLAGAAVTAIAGNGFNNTNTYETRSAMPMVSTKKKKAWLQNIAGGVIIFLCILVGGWWVLYTYNKNYEIVQGIAANHINEVCNETIVAPSEIGIDEGTQVWYVFAPVSHDCKHTGTEQHLWTLPR